MKYEEAIKSVGGCGRYQILMLNLLFISAIFDGLQIGSMFFIVPTIKHSKRFHASGKLDDSLPPLMMGVISLLLASALYPFIHETNNRPIVNTFDDVFKQSFELIKENDEYELEAKTHLIPLT